MRLRTSVPAHSLFLLSGPFIYQYDSVTHLFGLKKIPLYFISWLLFESANGQSVEPTKVLLLGVFHFDNPGLDVAKFKDANILSEKRQKEVMQLANNLKTFSPEKIFIESPAENQRSIDSSIAEYKRGKFALDANEIRQLGFRLAKDLDLPTLYGIDYLGADFPFDSLMKSARGANQSTLLGFIGHTIDSVQKAFNTQIESLSLSEILVQQNSEKANFSSVDFYFRLLCAGKKGDHVGSYLTSEWWRRNMIIYENLLKSLDGNEKRILVIFGSSHTALLREMMRFNRNLQLVNVEDVLKADAARP